MITCTKRWPSIPFAHRAPLHDGHCRFIHGHNWTVEAEFGATNMDANGFVMDFGKLKPFKAWLDANFDHALVIAESDPALKELKRLGPLAKLMVIPDCSCEGLAVLFFGTLDALVREQTAGRVRVHRLTVFEDEKNSATVTA